jgi:hypothetical protein
MMVFTLPLLVYLVLGLVWCSGPTVTAFSASKDQRIRGVTASFSSASDLLYEDQQNALERQALHEESLLSSKSRELIAPKVTPRAQAGTGFGGGKSKKQNSHSWLAIEQAKVLEQEGVIRIDQVLSNCVADQLRAHILEQQIVAQTRTEDDPSTSHSYYGIENRRKNRCDLQLSLLQGGYKADHGGVVNGDEPNLVAEALQELLGTNGSIRQLYEHLVTLQGEFYELAALVTNPGSQRQTVHPDLPFKEKAPLYVIFIALQDVTLAMGPTSFLLRTHTKEKNEKFNIQSEKDQLLEKAENRFSTLKKGDAVVFDARILHCGNANDPIDGSTRVLFNFSFRNPQVTGNLGYPGSIRPGYCGALTLQDIDDALVLYGAGDNNPFATYSDGLQKRRRHTS